MNNITAWKAQLAMRIGWHLTTPQRCIVLVVIPLQLLLALISMAYFLTSSFFLWLLMSVAFTSWSVYLGWLIWTHQYAAEQQDWVAYCGTVERMRDLLHLAPAQRADLIYFLLTQQGNQATLHRQTHETIINIAQIQKNKIIYIGKYPESTKHVFNVNNIYKKYVTVNQEVAIYSVGHFDTPARMWARQQGVLLVDGAILVEWCQKVARRAQYSLVPDHPQFLMKQRVADCA